MPRVSDHDLLKYLQYYILSWVVFVIVPFLIPYVADSVMIVYPAAGDEVNTIIHRVFGTSQANAFWETYEFISIVLGVLITFQCRAVPTAYNEGPMVSGAIYNWLFNWAVTKILVLYFTEDNTLDRKIFILAQETVGSYLFALSALFLQKLFILVRGSSKKDNMGSTSETSVGSVIFSRPMEEKGAKGEIAERTIDMEMIDDAQTVSPLSISHL